MSNITDYRMMNFKKKQEPFTTAGSSDLTSKDSKNCAEIIAGLGRVENTLKLIEVNGRGSDSEVRYVPREDGSKIYARVRCNLIQIGDIDTVKQEFVAEIFLGVTWKEPAAKGKKVEEIDWTEQWQPRVYFFNLVSTDKMQIFHSIFEPDDGGANSVPDVQLGIRMKATFKCEMNLRDFPFDYQPLTIKLMSDWALSQVEFVKDMNIKDSIRVDTFTGSQEWILHKHIHAQQVKEDKAKTGSHREYPIYHLTTHVQRKSAFYIWNIALIVLLIVLLSFTAFAVSPDEPADRLSVTLTLLLTAVAFKYVVTQSLPTISYLTMLDKYVLFGLVFQCLMVAQNALASIFGEHESIARLFDLISLVALAAIIIIAQIVFLIMAMLKRSAARRDLEKKTKDYEELCEQINRNWHLRQESKKQTAIEPMEIEENPETPVDDTPPPDAKQTSQNGNADTTTIDHMEGGAEPIKMSSKRSWRRSRSGSADKKKTKPEKNKVELLSIKPIGDIYPSDDLEAGSVEYDATL